MVSQNSFTKYEQTMWCTRKHLYTQGVIARCIATTLLAILIFLYNAHGINVRGTAWHLLIKCIKVKGEWHIADEVFQKLHIYTRIQGTKQKTFPKK